MHEKTTITASVRPQKVAVVVPADISEADFRDVIQFVGWLWGGNYSCVIPFDLASGDNELPLSWIEQYSPDLILCINRDIKDKLEGSIEECTNPPFHLAVLHEPLVDNFHYNSNGILPWGPAYLRYVKEINSMPSVTTRYRFVSTDEGVENRIFYDLSYGIHPKEECEALAKHLKAKNVHITDGSIPTFIDSHDDAEYPFSYLDLAGIELNTINSFGGAPTIFVLSRKVLDYAWFWNCRFDFSRGGNNCIPVPVDMIDDEETVQALASWITGYHSGRSTYCEVKSLSAPKAALSRLAARLRPRVRKHGVQHVDVKHCAFPVIPFVNVYHKSHDITAVWMDRNSFELEPPKPAFIDELGSDRSGRWVVGVDGGTNLKGHAPPKSAYKTNTKVLCAPSQASPSWVMSGYSRRYSGGNILIPCSEKRDNISLTLPTAEELFQPFFSGLGVGAKNDEKRTCYEATFDLFGGLRYFAECCRNLRYNILACLWSDKEVPCEKNGLAYSKGCHVKQADAPTPVSFSKIRSNKHVARGWKKPFSDNKIPLSDPLMSSIYESRCSREGGLYYCNYPSTFLTWLVEANIVRKVFCYPRCSNCLSKANWVTKIDLEKKFYCSRCGSYIPSHESQFDMEYQLNPLVCRAFDEGIRPVALTLDVLRDACSGFMFLPGFKGKRNDVYFDIDIVAACNGHLVLCECKDMYGASGRSKGWGKIKEQFSDLIDFGELCGASSVVLASLADTYPGAIHDMVKRRSTDKMRIVLLGKDELLRGNVQIKREDGGERRAMFYEAFLHPPKRRKKRKGERKISFGWGTRQSGE
ncbi:hypothetical protein [uncultured Pseudodesulfovibrio sp.]|uniref:hypothetical protein n=1 Tax=uncultured Pseudodesulfovibrio sp. TaxID=2035858 RepID=UPI0029C78664|nr:hypothetical protein [uncultured Pseudodesulfovibrio sp.]